MYLALGCLLSMDQQLFINAVKIEATLESHRLSPGCFVCGCLVSRLGTLGQLPDASQDLETSLSRVALQSI